MYQNQYQQPQQQYGYNQGQQGQQYSQANQQYPYQQQQGSPYQQQQNYPQGYGAQQQQVYQQQQQGYAQQQGHPAQNQQYYQEDYDSLQQYQDNFNSVQPRTRLEREAMKDKESIEKTRINQRVGYETRNTDVKQLLHNPDPKSTLFIPENQRFDKDFSVFDKQQRDQRFATKEVTLEKHRIEALERESKRWEQMENQVNKEQVKRQFQAEVLKAGKRNTNGMPFNPITLEYEKSNAGESLKKRDEMAKVRGYVRAENLDTRSNCGYNILTGEQRFGVEYLVPNHLKDDYKTKVDQKNEFYSIKYKGEQQYQQNQNKYY
ncbi:hypothetical protein ABPG72_006009 [Tetrahymena utriculariae]